MCILFMYAANRSKYGGMASGNNGVSSFPYKLILASNRDEKFSRPTKSAHYWDNSEEDSHILAGQDLEELGTWLGISKFGKLAILLNIAGSATTPDVKEITISRGSLVTGFLRSPPGLPGCTYLKNLCHLDISQKYKPFHLITVDLKGYEIEGTDEQCTPCECKYLPEQSISPTAVAAATPVPICVTYLTNQNQQKSEKEDSSAASALNPTFVSFNPQHMTPPANTCEFYAVGNSVIDKPFRKVECGKVEFKKIVTEHCEKNVNERDEESFVIKLLQFLKSTERHFPDKVMEEQTKGTGIPKALLPHFSSRFVSVAGVDYGTRTHTIILVDTKNNVTFHEWNMKEPINPANPEWSHKKFAFTVAFPA